MTNPTAELLALCKLGEALAPEHFDVSSDDLAFIQGWAVLDANHVLGYDPHEIQGIVQHLAAERGYSWQVARPVPDGPAVAIVLYSVVVHTEPAIALLKAYLQTLQKELATYAEIR
jgi:hypothetical protein